MFPDQVESRVRLGSGMLFAKGKVEEALVFARPVEQRRLRMHPQPIREIAPPAWPLPLIASQPRGPRRGT